MAQGFVLVKKKFEPDIQAGTHVERLLAATGKEFS